MDDDSYMQEAIALAEKCTPEKASAPRVGAVVVRDDKILARASRGLSPGNESDHAEFIALEKMLSGVDIAGATVYTTLEPCTYRGPEKTPCALRLIERQVSRVVIGILDPNPEIQGEGLRVLSVNGIEVRLLSHKHHGSITRINKNFIEHHNGGSILPRPLTITPNRVIAPICEVEFSDENGINKEQLGHALLKIIAGSEKPASRNLEHKLRLTRLGDERVDTLGEKYFVGPQLWGALRAEDSKSASVFMGLLLEPGELPSLATTLEECPARLRDIARSYGFSQSIVDSLTVRVRLERLPSGIALRYDAGVQAWIYAPEEI